MCYKLRSPEKCEECRAYMAALARRLTQTPGTFRYDTTHAVGMRAEAQNRRSRRWKRKRDNAKDQAKLDALRRG